METKHVEAKDDAARAKEKEKRLYVIFSIVGDILFILFIIFFMLHKNKQKGMEKPKTKYGYAANVLMLIGGLMIVVCDSQLKDDIGYAHILGLVLFFVMMFGADVKQNDKLKYLFPVFSGLLIALLTAIAIARGVIYL